MNGAYLFSSLRLLEGAIVLVLDGTTLFPSKDSLAFDIIGLQVLDTVGLTDRLDQSTHLVGELGNEDHGLEMRRDGAFRCCHSGESDEDGVNCKSGVSVSRDDDVHCRLKFLIGGGNSGFAVGSLEELPGLGGEHGVDIVVFLHRFLEKVQDGSGDGWVETKHDVSQGLVVDIEPVVDISLVFGGFANVFGRFSFGSSSFALTNRSGDDLIFWSRELVCNGLPLALREQVVHHHWLPGLPVHGTVEDRHEGHESGGHL